MVESAFSLRLLGPCLRENSLIREKLANKDRLDPMSDTSQSQSYVGSKDGASDKTERSNDREDAQGLLVSNGHCACSSDFSALTDQSLSLVSTFPAGGVDIAHCQMTLLSMGMGQELPEHIVKRCDALFQSQSFLIWSKNAPGMSRLPGGSTRWEASFRLSGWIEDVDLPSLRGKKKA